MLLSDLSSSVLVLLLVDLVLEDAALLRSSSTTDQSGIAIEVLADFLKRRVLGLNVVEPDEDEFDSEPDALEAALAVLINIREMAGKLT